MKILVALDGSLDSKAALKYGIRKVRELGGELIALHVFKSHCFIDYEAGPWAEEAARQEFSHHMEEAREIIREQGGEIRASQVIAEGHPEEEILRYAREEEVDLIVSTPMHDAVIKNADCLLDVVSAA